MKKLSLQLSGIKEMLTKEQMKKITGGYTGPVDPCDNECGSDSGLNCPVGQECHTITTSLCTSPNTVNVCW